MLAIKFSFHFVPNTCTLTSLLLFPTHSQHTHTHTLSNYLFFHTVHPPKIIQHPESKSVATGASTTLTFEASGDDLHYQWQKDGKDLHGGHKYHGTKTYTLHIKDVKKSDKGNYQCLVKNDVGELSEEVDLAVSKLPIMCSIT